MAKFRADVALNILYRSSLRPYRDDFHPIEILAGAGEPAEVPDALVYSIQLELGQGSIPGFTWVELPSDEDIEAQGAEVLDFAPSATSYPTFADVEVQRATALVTRLGLEAAGAKRIEADRAYAEGLERKREDDERRRSASVARQKAEDAAKTDVEVKGVLKQWERGRKATSPS